MKQILVRSMLKLITQNPKILAFALVGSLIGGGLWYEYETLIKRPQMTYMGVPKVASSWQNWSHILRNQGYMLEYSEKLGNPLWVTYKVTQNTVSYGKRPGFSADWRSPFPITSDDYTGSGYDRGHMAPNYVIASRYGRSAQLETFLMTNITPQNPKLNQKIWQRLEEVSANYFSQWYPEFWVVTGPIFDEAPQKLKGSRVAIPKAFYKIFIRPGENDQPPETLAFIMPQDVKPNASLMNFVTSIDQIEAATGIDFFHRLADEIEAPIEAASDPKAWQLEQVANLKSRY